MANIVLAHEPEDPVLFLGVGRCLAVPEPHPPHLFEVVVASKPRTDALHKGIKFQLPLFSEVGLDCGH